jgi:GTPase Era involved in 16S rRNA processing
MVPYLYNPLAQIPYKNLPNQNTVVMQNQYQNQGYQQQQNYPVLDNSNQGYQMQQMQQQNQQQADNLLSVPLTQFLNYQPTYYNQDMFTDEQKQQQGYAGYQPYFAH